MEIGTKSAMSKEQQQSISKEMLVFCECRNNLSIYGVENVSIERNEEGGVNVICIIPKDVHEEMFLIVFDDYVKALVNLNNKENPTNTITRLGEMIIEKVNNVGDKENETKVF